MGGKGNLALDNEAAIQRTEGIKKVVKEKFPDIKVVREQTGNWKRDQGKTIMENWLASGQEINGVAANNDEMALGALHAIKVAGKLGRSTAGATSVYINFLLWFTSVIPLDADRRSCIFPGGLLEAEVSHKRNGGQPR